MLELLHSTLPESVALLGVVLALRVLVAPLLMLLLDGRFLMRTRSSISALLTTVMFRCIRLPFSAVKVMRVVPSRCARIVMLRSLFCLKVIVPPSLALLLDNVAMRLFWVVQATGTSMLVAPLTTTGKRKVVPCLILMVRTLAFMAVGLDSIVKVTVARTAGLAIEVAVMVTLPGRTPLTRPSVSTVAILEAELVHVTALFVALAGST